MNKPFLMLFGACAFLLFACKSVYKATPPAKDFAVIAYYSGNSTDIEQYEAASLTHIIFSFLHLKGNLLAVDNAGDSLTIRKLVALKEKNPGLKVLLSLGGWGGCETCSAVFSTPEGRKEFAASLKALMSQYGADGIDLDWEYPVIEGYPGHPYAGSDKTNFTLLVRELRSALGEQAVISFAAGGFKDFLDQSIEWEKVMPLVNYVNVMTYDLVNGFSKTTGHHTPLYSTPGQEASTDYAVKYLISLGVPRPKIVIGAAFYARVWGKVADTNKGLFQSGEFTQFVPYRKFEQVLGEKNGFIVYWDSIAQAPYQYNPSARLFATFDDQRSVGLKTRYALLQQLGGIMFWQLGEDLPSKGLLQAIHRAH